MTRPPEPWERTAANFIDTVFYLAVFLNLGLIVSYASEGRWNEAGRSLAILCMAIAIKVGHTKAMRGLDRWYDRKVAELERQAEELRKGGKSE